MAEDNKEPEGSNPSQLEVKPQNLQSRLTDSLASWVESIAKRTASIRLPLLGGHHQMNETFEKTIDKNTGAGPELVRELREKLPQKT